MSKVSVQVDGGDLASQSGTTEGADRHAHRLLDVADAVARLGPITLNDLAVATALPRAAVWRALQVLRDREWLRMRHGDNAYVLNARVAQVFGHAATCRPEVGAALPLFERLSQLGPVHVDLGVFTELGEFRIVETTRKDGYGRPALSLTDDDIAVAAQFAMNPAHLVRHLTAFMTWASAEERQVISTGEHARHLREHRGAGQVRDADGHAVAFPLPGHPGAALRVELWRTSRARIAALEAGIAALLQDLRRAA